MRTALLPAALGTPCPLCGRAITTANAELDHIVARALGGQTTRENCRILCRDCNGQRGSRLGGQVANARRQARAGQSGGLAGLSG